MQLQIKNLWVKTATRIILKDVSLQVHHNEAISIIGPSGSGKTTLLKIVLGYFPSLKIRGEIFIDGMLIHKDQYALVPIQKRGLGYLSQNLALWPHCNIEKTLHLAQKFMTSRSTSQPFLLDTLIENCGLTHVRHALPCNLSGGEKQRLALARALITQPQLLILDEPFSNLDIVATRTLIEIIKTLKSSLKFSLIFVSHDLQESRALGDNVLVLYEGERYWFGQTSKLTHASFPPSWIAC